MYRRLKGIVNNYILKRAVDLKVLLTNILENVQ